MPDEGLRKQPSFKTVVPSIAEQMANPAGLAAETQQLQALIAEHRTLTFVKLVITQRLALAMLSLNLGNRPLSRAWVERLKTILREGRWEGAKSHQPGAFDTNGFLRDGQHRLLAIAETGIGAEMHFAFGMDPSVFPTIDVGMRRSGAQFLALAGVRNANLVQAFARLQHRVATGGAKLDDQGVFLTGMELCSTSDLVQRSIAAGFRMQSLAPVSAASFAFWKIALESPERDRLGKFWDQLVEGYELSRGDPILETRRLLARTKDASKKLHQMMQQTLCVVWIIWAWNEWVQGKTGGSPPRWTKAHVIPSVRAR